MLNVAEQLSLQRLVGVRLAVWAIPRVLWRTVQRRGEAARVICGVALRLAMTTGWAPRNQVTHPLTLHGSLGRTVGVAHETQCLGVDFIREPLKLAQRR